MQPRPKQLLISIPEAAKMLGVSRQRVWVLVREGRLRSVAVSPRAYAVRNVDVQRLISERKGRADPR